MALLPTARTQAKTALAEYTIVAYGAPKTGKTTWAAGFPNVLFLATESGQNALSVFKVDVTSWDTFLEACRELAEGKHSFENVCIDTIDNLWQLCRQYVCEKFKIEFEGDLQFGKGHALVLNEFTRVLTKLSMLPYGLIIISHAAQEEVSTRTGTYNKVVPSLKDKARKFVLGLSDFILFFDLEHTAADGGKPRTRRILHTKPSKFHEGGDRTGRLPEVLPVDHSAFVTAFAQATANPQTETIPSKGEAR